MRLDVMRGLLLAQQIGIEDVITYIHMQCQPVTQQQTVAGARVDGEVAVIGEFSIADTGDQVEAAVESEFAADEGPDIFIVEGPSQAKLWGDHIADLSDQPWVDEALPFTLKDMQIDGQLMGMPVNLEGYGYIYNKAIFQEAGVRSITTLIMEVPCCSCLLWRIRDVKVNREYGIAFFTGRSE